MAIFFARERRTCNRYQQSTNPAMSHITHHCRCGKTIHWPHNAKAGDVWVCRRCRCQVTLVKEGGDGEKPVRKASRPNAADRNPDYHAGGASPSRTSGAGSPSRASSSKSSPSTSSSPKSSQASSSSGSTRSSKKEENSGCFVATAVYGSYEHPSVLILRRFRDETLQPRSTGRILIALYYRFGPNLAKIVGKNLWLSGLSRHILDNIVNIVK